MKKLEWYIFIKKLEICTINQHIHFFFPARCELLINVLGRFTHIFFYKERSYILVKHVKCILILQFMHILKWTLIIIYLKTIIELIYIWKIITLKLKVNKQQIVLLIHFIRQNQWNQIS
jgi:hypothetical protein